MRGLSALGPSLSLRVIERDGEPWFVAKDVCDALGLGNITEALRLLDDDEADFSLVEVRGTTSVQPRRMRVLSEPGLYRVIMRSDKAAARPFQRFVTREVLPAIRKH